MSEELKKLIALEDVQQEAYDTVRSRVIHDGGDPDKDEETQALFAQLNMTQDKIDELQGGRKFNKNYNKNDCANNLFELAEFIDPMIKIESVSKTIAFLLCRDMTIEEISSEISYTIDHIVELVEECDNLVVFTCFVGGTEVNDYLVTLSNALALCDKYIQDGYDDAQISAYYQN